MSVLGAWVAVLLRVNTPLYISGKTRSGLVAAYPPKVYAIPANLRFYAHESLFEGSSLRYNAAAVAKLDVDKGVVLTRKGYTADVLTAHLLEPRRHTEPGYKLVVAAFHESEEEGEKAVIDKGLKHLVFKAQNLSSDKKRSISYYVFLAPVDEEIKIRHMHKRWADEYTF